MLPVLLLILVFSLIYSPTSAKDNDTENDPFHYIARFKPPKIVKDIICLPSDAPPELLSFEEWKAKQLQVIQPPVAVVAPDSVTAPETVPLELNNPPKGQPPPKMIPHQLPQGPQHAIPLTNRFNYASSECSARLHASSSTNPHHILSSKKDKYLLAPCKSHRPKYVIAELCDDIRIDTVQLANFEFFSGVFKTLRIGVAQTLPVGDPESWDGWTEMGTYTARNVRGVQTFRPQSETTVRPFYRYIRIDFLSHYGNEYYCPVSLLRVYGLTQMEEWIWEGREQTMKIAPVSAGRAVSEESAAVIDVTIQPTPVAPGIKDADNSQIKPSAPTSTHVSVESAAHPVVASPDPSQGDPTESPVATTAPLLSSAEDCSQESARSIMDVSRSGGAEAGSMSASSSASNQQTMPGNSNEAALLVGSASSVVAESRPSQKELTKADYEDPATSIAITPSTSSIQSSPSTSLLSESVSGQSSTKSAEPHPASSTISSEGAAGSSVSGGVRSANPSPVSPQNSGERAPPAVPSVITSAEGIAQSNPGPVSAQPSTGVLSQQSAPYVPPSHPQPVFTLARTIGTGSTGSATTGESVFRTLSNRLTSLEVNTSLYSLFLEEQTRSIRTSLHRMEDHLSVVERDLRRVVHESEIDGGGLVGRLEWARERERERALWEGAMSNCKQRIDRLADEIRAEKRLGVAQLVLLVLVLFFSGINRWGLSIGVEPFQAASIVEQISGSLTMGERKRVTSLSSIFGRQFGHGSRLSQGRMSLAETEASERSRAESMVSEGQDAKDAGHMNPSSTAQNAPLVDRRNPKSRPPPLPLNMAPANDAASGSSVSRSRASNHNRRYPVSAGLVSSFPFQRSRSNTPTSTLRGHKPRIIHRSSSNNISALISPPDHEQGGSNSQWDPSSAYLDPLRTRKLAKTAHLHEVKPRDLMRSGSRVRRSAGGGEATRTLGATMEDITNLEGGSYQATDSPLEPGGITPHVHSSQPSRSYRRGAGLMQSRYRRTRSSRPPTPQLSPSEPRASTSGLPEATGDAGEQEGDSEVWIDMDTTETEQEHSQELEIPNGFELSPSWNLNRKSSSSRLEVTSA